MPISYAAAGDQVVYVGAHRDSWTYGSDDNLSGTETVMQIGRGLGKLLKTGWPGSGKTIYQDWSAKNGGKTPPIGRLGSGSDYTAFFDRFGVPSVDIGAGTDSGNYHCSCDNFYMEDTFIDPGWKYHVAMAQEVGVVTMRLANADVPPLDYASYAAEVVTYLTAFQKQRLLVASEHQLLAAQGLPRRPWFRHQLYAPGINAGYGTQKLPGINDALFEYHNVGQARAYEASLYGSLRAAAAVLGAVT